MKFRKFKKALSMLLTFAIVVGITGTSGIGAIPDWSNSDEDFIPGTSLRVSEIPEVIDRDVIARSNHTARLYEYETDLNSVVFRNADDTNTLYLFGEPIKFIAQDGSVRDKSNRLYSDNSEKYAYVNLENDIRTYFPRTLDSQTGVKLTDGNYSVERLPIFANTARVDNRSRSFDDNWVYYDGIFGRHTALRYTPTFEGFKEEVVLEQNIGINRFSFTVRTNGLTLIYDGNSYSLIDPTTRKVVGNIGEIIVYDSSGNDMVRFDSSYRHFYETAVVRENEEYCVTIVVDEKYLEQAVYPVYVDPTTNLIASGSGNSKTIQDATIIQNSSVTYGSNPSLFAGSHDRGAARTLIQFPGLSTNSTLRHIPASQITSAFLRLFTNSNSAANTIVGAFRYTGAAWDELTAHGNNTTCWSTVGQPQQTITVGTGSNVMHSWSVIEAVRHWKNVPGDLKKGLVLVNQSEVDTNRTKTFHSTEGSTSSRHPHLAVTWSGFTYMFANSSTRAISSRYGDRPPPSGGGSTEHKGVDIIASNGTTLRSVGGGNVVYAQNTGGALGNYVVIELDAVHPTTGRRLRVGYAHLASISVSSTGQPRIEAGASIGSVGNSGTSAYHLHFQVMIDGGNFANQTNYRNTVNPLQYFPDIAFTYPNQSTPDPNYSRTHRRCRTNSGNLSSAVNYVPHPPIVARCPTCNVAQP